MCSRTLFAVSLFVLARVTGFGGDVCLLQLLIRRTINYEIRLLETEDPLRTSSDPVDVTITPDNTYNEYCIHVEREATLGRYLDSTNAFRHMTSLVAFGAIFVFALLIHVPIASVCFPPVGAEEQPVGDDLADDNVSIDYAFRERESGGKRFLRYLAPLSLIAATDVPMATLGTELFAGLVDPLGPRCYECGGDCVNDEYVARDWNRHTVFPVDDDYFWLLFMGGKVVATAGSVALVFYLEFNYRHQFRVFEDQQKFQLIRRHFGRTGSASNNPTYFFRWLQSFLATFLSVVAFIGVMLLPTLLVIYNRMYAMRTLRDVLPPGDDEAEERREVIPTNFFDAFQILLLCCAGLWGVLLLASTFACWKMLVCRQRRYGSRSLDD